jgi:hypothetical protein
MAKNQTRSLAQEAQREGCKIGWDWPLVKIAGKLYARNPMGHLVRVTDADINGQVVSLTRKFGLGR